MPNAKIQQRKIKIPSQFSNKNDEQLASRLVGMQGGREKNQ